MKELIQSLQTIWKDLTVGQRITLIGSVTLVLVSIGVLLFEMNRPNLALLYGGLAPEETAKVVEFLKANKINYTADEHAVNIAADKVAEVRIALAAQGIPRASDTAGGIGFELLDKQSWGQSDFAQKTNYQRALQGELARTIRQIDEISEARVMIVSPEDRLFRPVKQEAKASVFLKLKMNRTLSEEKIQAIRFLVANSVENLNPERVAIVDNFGRSLAPDQQSNTLANINASQLNIQREQEERLRDKAQSMLDRVLGPGQAVVKVSAEMDFDTVTESSEKFDPDGSVIRNENSTIDNQSSETPEVGGAAGTPSDLAGEKAAAKKAILSKQERTTKENRYEIGRTVTTINHASGTIKRLSIAVTINSMPFSMPGSTNSTKAADPKALPPKRTQQELDSLRDLVKDAVGFSANDARKDSITISETPFVDIFAGTEEKVTTITTVKNIFDTYSTWIQQGCFIAFALGLLFYLWSVMNSGTVKEEPEGAFSDLIKRFEDMERKTTFDLEEMTAGNGKSNGHGVHGGRGELGRRGGAAAVPERTTLSPVEMGKLMQENPENATQAIKKWLNKN